MSEIKDVYILITVVEEGQYVQKYEEEELIEELKDKDNEYEKITFYENFPQGEFGTNHAIIIHLNTGEVAYPKFKKVTKVNLAFKNKSGEEFVYPC